MLELGKLVAEFAEGENNVPGTTATDNEVFSSFFFFKQSKTSSMVATGQKMVGEKILQGQGKVRKLRFKSGKN